MLFKKKTNWKPYLYVEGQNIEIDGDFERAVSYARMKLGDKHLFWELGFRWYMIKLDRVRRIYRRAEETLTQVGCRPGVIDIQKLIVQLDDGSVLAIQVGEGERDKEAKALYEALQQAHPELQYGKE